MGTQSDFLVGLINSVGNVNFETVYQTELPRLYNFFRYRTGDEMYMLRSPGAAVEDLIRMAESIP